MAHMAQSGNIRGLWSLWGLADIVLEKNSFWVSHKFHFYFYYWKKYSIFYFLFLKWWSSIISQFCDSSGAAKKRWWGSGQFIYGLSLLHLSSCKRGKLVYEAHLNFMDHSPWFRVCGWPAGCEFRTLSPASSFTRLVNPNYKDNKNYTVLRP